MLSLSDEPLKISKTKTKTEKEDLVDFCHLISINIPYQVQYVYIQYILKSC